MMEKFKLISIGIIIGVGVSYFLRDSPKMKDTPKENISPPMVKVVEKDIK